MDKSLKISFAQLNPTVGAVSHNANLILDAYEKSFAAGADLLVCPEMVLSGYMPQDLVQKPSFLRSVEREIQRLAMVTGTGGPGILFGAPLLDQSAEPEIRSAAYACWPGWGQVFNAAIYVDRGKIQAKRYKHRLPDIAVFDDSRVFRAGDAPTPIDIRGVRIAVPICEDVWWDHVLEKQAQSGAEIFISLNASPWQAGKPDIRQQIAIRAVQTYKMPFVYLNLVGGQDEIVFDGSTFCMNSDPDLAMQMPMFTPHLEHTQWNCDEEGWRMDSSCLFAPLSERSQVYNAILGGIRDYLGKNGFSSVILGLSGGIDSALTAIMAVDAIGAENVQCFMMPSCYTSPGSLDDATQLADRLGLQLMTIPIEPALESFSHMLSPIFETCHEQDSRGPAEQAEKGENLDKKSAKNPVKTDIVSENLQSRIRGVLLMALSNKLGSLVLTTGNKSEIAVGYTTLYGDMCGAYNLIGDLYKTQVFEISRWRNRHFEEDWLGPAESPMPDSILLKAPSAELRPDQKDQDTLPPYEILDPVLYALIEKEESLAKLVKDGFDETLVRRVVRMINLAEFKRRQSSPAVRVSKRGFGRDRRYPVTNAYEEN